jgi:hypothetical protein
LLKDDTKYNFKSRASSQLIWSLDKHWCIIQSLISRKPPEEILADSHVAPVKPEPPEDKSAGWRLDLADIGAAEAQRQLELLNQ